MCRSYNESSAAEPQVARAATVGTFDGVHPGHRLVLSVLRREAEARGLRPMVVTFDRHPLETLRPERVPGLVMSPVRRDGILRSLGFEVEVCRFTPEFASLTAREWIRRLRDSHGVRLVVIGYDNTFGSDGRRMTCEDYIELGKSEGVEVIDASCRPGVSSTTVRHALAAGDVEEAASLLGEPFEIEGRVVHGRALGRTIGFPTANIEPSYRAALPHEGVYAADVCCPDGEWRRSVVNIGRRPSVEHRGDAPLSIEAHIIGYAGDLYGRMVRVRFLRRLRGERRFAGLEELREAISRDVAQASEIPTAVAEPAT